MSLMTNIIILLTIWSVGLYVLGFTTPLTNTILDPTSAFTHFLNGIESQFGENSTLILFLSGAAIVITGIFTGWNFIYMILVPLLVILISFMTWPQDIFNSASFTSDDFAFMTLFKTMYTLLEFLLAIGIINWWRGSQE